MSGTTQYTTRYPILRLAVRQELAYLDDVELAHEIAIQLPGLNADELEFSFRQLGRSLGPVLAQVGNVAVRAAPGAISGALQGATMGAALGPYGMLAGAALGAVGGGVVSYSQSQQQPQATQTPGQPQAQPQAVPVAGQQAQRQVPVQPQVSPVRAGAHNVPPQQMAVVHQRAPQLGIPAGTPQIPAGAGTQNTTMAVAQLLQLLARPETIQALMVLSAGALGRQNIQVGTQSVRPTEVLNAISEAFHAVGIIGADSLSGEAVGSPQASAWILEEMTRTPVDSHPLVQTLQQLEGQELGQSNYDISNNTPLPKGYEAFGY